MFFKVIVTRNGEWFAVAVCIQIVEKTLDTKKQFFVPSVWLVEEIDRVMDWSPLPLPDGCDEETARRFYMYGRPTGKCKFILMDEAKCAAFTTEWGMATQNVKKNLLKCIVADINGIC